MTITEAIYSRHAVRSYVLRPLKEETAAALRTEIDRLQPGERLCTFGWLPASRRHFPASGRGGRAFPACPAILCWRESAAGIWRSAPGITVSGWRFTRRRWG
jgi:hypothetical protein